MSGSGLGQLRPWSGAEKQCLPPEVGAVVTVSRLQHPDRFPVCVDNDATRFGLVKVDFRGPQRGAQFQNPD